MRISFTCLVVAVVIAANVAASTDEMEDAPQGSQTTLRKPDVFYVGTPQSVVDGMLKLAGVKKGDVVYDLGCGDGRVVVSAAMLGARGVGVDIDQMRVNEANANVKNNGVADRVKILHADMFETDIRDATVVPLFLFPEVNLRLRPKLWKELKPGTRIVSHQFDMGDWKPDRKISMGDNVVYLWTVPADAAKRAEAEDR